MYKKITHAIMEEHYDHPALAVEAMQQRHTGTGMNDLLGLAVIPPLTRFKFQSQRDWYQYLWYLNESIHAIMLADNTKIDATLQQLLFSAAQVASISRGVFGIDSSILVNNDLTAVTQDYINIIKAVKAGTSTDTLKATLAQDISTLSNDLSSLNPNVWNTATITTSFNNLLNLILAQIASITAGDWLGEIAQRESIKTLILEIADLYASGQSK